MNTKDLTQDAPILHTEYAQSDEPTVFDPVERESVIHSYQQPYRLVAQLLRWAAPKMIAYANKGGNFGGGDTGEWENCLGCDATFITEAIKGVRRLNWFGDIDRRELVDVILYVEANGWSKIQPIYKGERPDTFKPMYDADWIIICREFESSCGHGLKWLEISKGQAVKLLEHWLDNSLIGLWRPRTTSKGDTPEAVFLTNLTDPVDKAPVGGRDHCVISRHVDQADSRELQRWYDRLRDLERNGDQDRLEEIADVIMQSGKSGRKIRDLVFG